MRKGIPNSVGITRTGKEIFALAFNRELRENEFAYLFEDHFDAYCVFEYLALREKRKAEESDDYINYERHAAFYSEFLRRNRAFARCASEAGITSAFTVRDHGQRLVHVEYRDF